MDKVDFLNIKKGWIDRTWEKQCKKYLNTLLRTSISVASFLQVVLMRHHLMMKNFCFVALLILTLYSIDVEPHCSNIVIKSAVLMLMLVMPAGKIAISNWTNLCDVNLCTRKWQIIPHNHSYFDICLLRLISIDGCHKILYVVA